VRYVCDWRTLSGVLNINLKQVKIPEMPDEIPGRKTFSYATPLPAGSPAAVLVGDRFFTSGIVSDRTGGLESESHRVFQLIAELLRSSGIASDDVVRTRIWHTSEDGAEAEKMLRIVHGVIFQHPGPALTIIQVEMLPDGVEVSVELEATADGGQRAKKYEPDFESSSSQAVRVGDEMWTSGLHGDPNMDPATQVTQAIEDATGLMKQAGIGPGDIVSTRHFMRHNVQFELSPPEWLAFKEPSIPTSAGITVSGVGEPGYAVMFEMEGAAGAADGRPNLRTGRTFEVEHNYCRAVLVDDGDVI
jgi:enamine deaminase RidA (YjgF/YER057c/UK114 family)